MRVPVFTVISALLLGCATTSGQLQRDAASCETFADFDELVRRQLDALLADAPGDTLVREASRLNTARRTCARHVISGLIATREARGVEAVQQELDALSATYQQADLRALLTEALGTEVAQLEPLLVEARQRVNRRGSAAGAEKRDAAERAKLKAEVPDSMGATPVIPDSMCDEREPCAQLKCVVEQSANPEAPARACLDAAAGLEPAQRAQRAADVLAMLPSGASAARTEARMMLDTLRNQLWPQVEAAVAARQPGRAAQLASPFRTLPRVSAQVEALRDAAQAHHLARANELSASPEAAWLHRRLAEEFGGPVAPALPGTGKWERTRWQCKEPVPAFPELAGGLTAMLTLRCREAAPVKKSTGDDAMRTFELEKSLQGERLDGSITMTCADRVNSYSFRVEEPGIEGFPEEGLRQELTRLAARAVTDCAHVHETAAVRSCTEVRKLDTAAVLTRFVDHARFLHRWEPCFTQWLISTEGVAPPTAP